MLTKNKISLFLISIIFIISLKLSANAQMFHVPIWKTYHEGSLRAGHNPESNADPAGLNLIWVFPRDVGGGVDENLLTVDDIDDAGDLFTIFPGSNDRPALEWESGVSNAYSGHYYVIRAEKPDYREVPYTANWKVPSQLPKGTYKIYIWVVGEDNATQKARYTVFDDNGRHDIIFDQANGQGWRPLSNKAFTFETPGNPRVVLSNAADDAADSPDAIRQKFVYVDAIRFVPATGQEIYASPASAIFPYTYRDEDTNTTRQFNAPFVYVGTVESPIGRYEDAPDTGAMYCINSVTGTLEQIGNIDDDDEKNFQIGLTKKLGTAIWRYPNQDPSKWAEYEGPIEGGFYASPTIARVEDDKLVVYMAAMDRQVYAVNAKTGELLWKGPGVTQPEEKQFNDPIPDVVKNDDIENDINDWNQSEVRNDAFGGRFRWIDCESAGDSNKHVVWTFTDADRKLAGEPEDGGLAYAVYVWIPGMKFGDKSRAEDAEYTIYYTVSGQSGVTTESVKVTISQALDQNQGRWVRLGSSFFNVKAVVLSNKTSASNPSSVCVVADAVQIVPESIGAFGYCTPVLNQNDIFDHNGVFTLPPTKLFALNSNGRLLSFNILPQNSGKKIGTVNWIFPKVRTKLVISGPEDQDFPSMESMGSSPAYFNDKLYIAGFNGVMRCLRNVSTDNPEQLWSHSVDDEEFGSDEGFTSTPAIDKDTGRIYVGSNSGYFYCWDDNGVNEVALDLPPLWRYPEKQAEGQPMTPPLGAFRYSTAAIANDDAGRKRAWIGSTDGRIYSFLLADGVADRRLRLDENGNPIVADIFYREPNVFAPIQGSVALGGGTVGNPLYMFVGDMAGRLTWFRAGNGSSQFNYSGFRTDGELFSSPNVTHFYTDLLANTKGSYVYVGSADGRIYAFSDRAYGGQWAGGQWPFPGTPDDTSRRITALGKVSDIQFDIFPNWFYKNSSVQNVEEAGTNLDYGRMPMPWPADIAGEAAIVSEDMKLVSKNAIGDTDDKINEHLRKEAEKRRKWMVRKDGASPADPYYFEWGETINLIVWNLPPRNQLEGRNKANSIQFRLSNASPGSSAGSTLAFGTNVKVLKEYTVLNKDDFKVVDEKTEYRTLKNEKNEEVKRCFALADIQIRGNQSRPPSPGPGWVLTAEISTDEAGTTIIPLAKVRSVGDGFELVLIPQTQGGEADTYQDANVGFNNPLAIKAGTSEIAWPNNFNPNRNDPEAHFNGNMAGDNQNVTRLGTPLLDYKFVSHGNTSHILNLGVMDRSAVGINFRENKQEAIERFKINTRDLRWRGGEQEISRSGGILLPWEQGPGSIDYPWINKNRQFYNKATDNLDPSREHTTLPPIDVPSQDSEYKDGKLRADVVDSTVDVPLYQPANREGYSRTIQAYVDSDGNGEWDSGDVVRGRPTTYQEAYRRFAISVKVPADPKIEVVEPIINIGSAPHGLGVGLVFENEFTPFNPNPDVQSWFKNVTIRNRGNVNISNIRINRNSVLVNDQDIRGEMNPIPPGAR
ncbi:MAG: hypothetical protein SNJ70_09030, partial [Armatimonadota bacterium]